MLSFLAVMVSIIVTPFSLADRSEEEVAYDLVRKSQNRSAFITDTAHSFDETFRRALLAERALHVLWLAYYDNPEAFVPADLFSIMTRVVKASHQVLFANKNLAYKKNAEAKKIDLPFEKRVGIGFYPKEQAEKIKEKRTSQAQAIRAALCLEDKRPLVYMGGCNEEYFTHAFPTFLTLLEHACTLQDLSSYAIVLQQHPRAKKEGDYDRALFEQWKSAHAEDSCAPTLIFSTLPTEDVLAVADMALYYQTSMAASLALAGIPTIQIADLPFNDLLVRSGLCTFVNSPKQLLVALEKRESKEITKEEIMEGLGTRDDWADFLEFAINPYPYATSIDAIRGLATKLGIDPEEDLVQATQRLWLRPKGRERWQLSAMESAETYTILNFAKKEGLFTTLEPRFTHYEAALILGASTKRMEERLSYLKEIWESGARFDEIVFLLGERPLDPEVDHYLDRCTNEAEAAHLIWQEADIPEQMRTLPTLFIALPMKEGGHRPTTEDTILAWLQQQPYISKALFVSDQPFCAYQGAVIEGCLPNTMLFDLVGRGITVEKEDFSDLLSHYPYAPRVILDSLARELYQKNLNIIQ